MKIILKKMLGNYWLLRTTVLFIILISGTLMHGQCSQNCSGTNTRLGVNAGPNITASLNTCIGHSAGEDIVSGFGNSLFGASAGANITGSTNSCFGAESGLQITTGSNNVCLGRLAGPTAANGGLSDRLYIDIEESDDPLIYGEFDNDFIRINGDLEVLAGLGNPSSRSLKQDFRSLMPFLVLNKLSQLDIREWSYTNDQGVRHIGPTAEEFHMAFGLGSDKRSISTIDADGVKLVAIQALHEMVNENAQYSQKLQAYEKENKEIEARIIRLEKLLNDKKNRQEDE